MPNFNFVDTSGRTQSITANSAQEAIANSVGTRASDSGVQEIVTPVNNTSTLPVATTNPNNPVISGTGTANNNAATTTDVNNLYDNAGLSTASNNANKLLQDRYDALTLERDNTVNGITRDYEQALRDQAERQGRDYAGESTNLVTAGGGFLGFTGSHAGVLQNLQHTFDGEKTALLAKRDAAIQAAKNAIDEKQFGLAKEQAALARDTEKELYSRQKDFADQKLALAREARAQQEFDIGIMDKKIEGYSNLSDDDFAKVPKSQLEEIDKFYGAGYAINKRKIDKAIADGKTMENDVELRTKIQDLINKTPYGQHIKLGGVDYVGMKKATGSGTAAGTISSTLANQLGVPSLAGKDESDVILSLSFNTAPQWYKEFYQASNPTVYAQIASNPQALNADWNLFKAQPDIQAYANSSTVTNRIEKANGGSAAEQLKAQFGAIPYEPIGE